MCAHPEFGKAFVKVTAHFVERCKIAADVVFGNLLGKGLRLFRRKLNTPCQIIIFTTAWATSKPTQIILSVFLLAGALGIVLSALIAVLISSLLIRR